MIIEPLLTTEQLCTIFQVTDKTIYNWRKSKTNPFPEPAVKGYPNKWKRSDIENYINPKAASAA